MTEDKAIVQLEWRPLTSDDSALGSVTIKRGDGTEEDRGTMTRADTARLAHLIFGGSATRVSVGDRIVKWVQRDSR